MTVKASGAESGGAFSLIEVQYPPGFAPPLHLHHHEDESFYVLDGEVTFTCQKPRYRLLRSPDRLNRKPPERQARTRGTVVVGPTCVC